MLFIMERNVFFVFVNIHYLGVWLHLIFQEGVNEAYSSFGSTIEKEGVCSINPAVVSGVDSAHAHLQLAVD